MRMHTWVQLWNIRTIGTKHPVQGWRHTRYRMILHHSLYTGDTTLYLLLLTRYQSEIWDSGFLAFSKLGFCTNHKTTITTSECDFSVMRQKKRVRCWAWSVRGTLLLLCDQYAYDWSHIMPGITVPNTKDEDHVISYDKTPYVQVTPLVPEPHCGEKTKKLKCNFQGN